MWGNCNKGLSEKLQRLQNRAARTLMSVSYDNNFDDLFRALGLAKTLLSEIAAEVYPNVKNITWYDTWLSKIKIHIL